MFKFFTLCLLALIAVVSAKPSIVSPLGYAAAPLAYASPYTATAYASPYAAAYASPYTASYASPYYASYASPYVGATSYIAASPYAAYPYGSSLLLRR